MRLAVEAYATQHRRQAEDEARKIVADAEKRATAAREAAEKRLQEVEADVRRREDELRSEVRKLEHRRRETLERLRELVAAVQDVLPGEESLARDLQPQQSASRDS
jgi:predicted  nucleic acid-binding Zn-ribbon protein